MLKRFLRGRCGRPSSLVEALESRLLLSGNVTAQLSSHDLYVHGDAADNAILIDQVGLKANQYRVSSADATTTINGKAGPIIITGVTGALRIDTGAGNDIVTVRASTTGDINVTSTTGSKSLFIDTVTVAGHVFVTTGTGTHAFTLLNSSTIATHAGCCALFSSPDVAICNGAGDSSTTIDHSTIGGYLTVHNLTGADTLTLSTATIRRDVAVSNGDGNATSTVDHSSVCGDFCLRNGTGNDTLLMTFSSVGGTLSITNGNGSAATSINSSSLGALCSTSGNGINSFSADSSTIAHDAVIRNGNGDAATGLSNTTIKGTLTVRNGNGDNSLSLVSVTVAGARTCYSDCPIQICQDHTCGVQYTPPCTTVTKSCGTITPSCGTVTKTCGPITTTCGGYTPPPPTIVSCIPASVVFSNGDGTIATSILSSKIAGEFDMYNGKGAHALSVGSATSLGGLNLSNGDGDSASSISSSSIGGCLQIRNRAGNDTLSILGTTIARNAFINNGDGDTSTGMDSCTFGGSLTFICGLGTDTFALSNSKIAGSATVNTGTGGTTLTIAPGQVGGKTIIQGT